MTRPPKELANNVGNASLPRTGASIANSVLRTAHGTGCCKVSTPDQKLDAQLDAVWAAGGEKVFQVVHSGFLSLR